MRSLDILSAASGEDSYGAGCWSGLFGGFLHNRLSSTEDNKEASLLGCPPIGLVDEEKFMVRNQEGLISPGLKHRGFTPHAGNFRQHKFGEFLLTLWRVTI